MLLFNEGRVVKLSDFSTAVHVDKVSEKENYTDGRLIYCAAPEVIQEDTPSPSSDVWSAMCTMVQMLTSRHPGCHKGYRRPMAMMLLVSSSCTCPALRLTFRVFPTVPSVQCHATFPPSFDDPLPQCGYTCLMYR